MIGTSDKGIGDQELGLGLSKFFFVLGLGFLDPCRCKDWRKTQDARRITGAGPLNIRGGLVVVGPGYGIYDIKKKTNKMGYDFISLKFLGS